MRKNPDNKMLKIISGNTFRTVAGASVYGSMLVQLAVAESNLVRAGKSSAMPHFLAIVKELERVYDFHFEIMED